MNMLLLIKYSVFGRVVVDQNSCPVKLAVIFGQAELGAEDGVLLTANAIGYFLRDYAYEQYSPPGLKEKTASLACWVFAQNPATGLEICADLIQSSCHLDSTPTLERWATMVGIAKIFLERLQNGAYKN